MYGREMSPARRPRCDREWVRAQSDNPSGSESYDGSFNDLLKGIEPGGEFVFRLPGMSDASRATAWLSGINPREIDGAIASAGQIGMIFCGGPNVERAKHLPRSRGPAVAVKEILSVDP